MNASDMKDNLTISAAVKLSQDVFDFMLDRLEPVSARAGEALLITVTQLAIAVAKESAEFASTKYEGIQEEVDRLFNIYKEHVDAVAAA